MSLTNPGNKATTKSKQTLEMARKRKAKAKKNQTSPSRQKTTWMQKVRTMLLGTFFNLKRHVAQIISE